MSGEEALLANEPWWSSLGPTSLVRSDQVPENLSNGHLKWSRADRILALARQI